ncbi:hypothetical protein [Pseudoalteromonas piscicida]|uniref:hypothetical protein n=1 Tax=Pseudoalteromonas piscicida TaxID=43662 RepID=UPI0030979271
MFIISFTASSCELALLDDKVVLNASKAQPKCRFKQNQIGELTAVTKFTTMPISPTTNSAITAVSFSEVNQLCKVNGSNQVISCNFGTKTTLFELTDRQQQGRIAAVNWRKDNHFYVGWSSDQAVLMGYIAFGYNTSPFWIPASQACQYGLSEHIIPLSKGDLLCKTYEQVWIHSRLLPLPLPCQRPQQMIQDKEGIWALEFDASTYQWQVCKYSENIGNLITAYDYSIDLAATLARYDLQPSEYTKLNFLFEDNASSIADAVEITDVFPVGDTALALDPQAIELPIQQIRYKLVKRE